MCSMLPFVREKREIHMYGDLCGLHEALVTLVASNERNSEAGGQGGREICFVLYMLRL